MLAGEGLGFGVKHRALAQNNRAAVYTDTYGWVGAARRPLHTPTLFPPLFRKGLGVLVASVGRHCQAMVLHIENQTM